MGRRAREYFHRSGERSKGVAAKQTESVAKDCCGGETTEVRPTQSCKLFTEAFVGSAVSKRLIGNVHRLSKVFSF